MLFSQRCVTITAVLLLATGCGSGGSSSNSNSGSGTVPPTQTPAVIGGQDTGSVSEVGTSTASGSLTISDQQTGEDVFQVQSNVSVDYGTFSIDTSGNWSYELDQTSASVNQFPGNYSEDVFITVNSQDGTSHQITITISGANDAASFEFSASSNQVNSNASDAINGTIMVSDADNGESQMTVQNDQAYSYGVFSISSTGSWTYTLDINNNAVVTLQTNETLIETITVYSVDGSSTSFNITIVGTDTLPVSGSFVLESETIVSSDGVNSGLSAYELIENAFAEGSIEAPDFYSSNHDDVAHIFEDEDTIVGPHFVFLAHRDEDYDRDGGPSDRQRNEIKTYDKSREELKSYEGQTFQYTWKFKIDSELELSSRFSHFFQIKAKNYSEDNSNGNDNQPIFTLSGAERSSTGNEMQVRYNSGYDINGDSTSDVYMTRVNWSLITDEWLEVFVQITYAEQGKFDMTVTRMSDNTTIIDLSEDNIDTWRGVEAADFVRPKWGIYRSILETESLRAEEEQVRFADFTIRKGYIQP